MAGCRVYPIPAGVRRDDTGARSGENDIVLPFPAPQRNCPKQVTNVVAQGKRADIGGEGAHNHITQVLASLCGKAASALWGDDKVILGSGKPKGTTLCTTESDTINSAVPTSSAKASSASANVSPIQPSSPSLTPLTTSNTSLTILSRSWDSSPGSSFAPPTYSNLPDLMTSDTETDCESTHIHSNLMKSMTTGNYQLASNCSLPLADFISGNKIPTSAIIIDIPKTHTSNVTDILPPYSECLNDGPKYKAPKCLPHAVFKPPGRKKPVFANSKTSKLPKVTRSSITTEDHTHWVREVEEHAVKLSRVRAAMSLMEPRIGRVSA
ncbi:hypothetical protein DACRYDRAFT_108290 [Dacryopinax primogenitus]|uniref:Uncharacterized protein n=1 Tax=Dacryopinax primogenitus (strain DJM 731) TaxID=1858805 RepID=M5G528_DACPD|nr:uncharacterized protein DACRYDRAFT_108290 [Dacryopinax primogenitus]EJU00947.1 hypothetical protein DACRYDRAFT_108290 [Dacryopinax primogenitus]